MISLVAPIFSRRGPASASVPALRNFLSRSSVYNRQERPQTAARYFTVVHILTTTDNQHQGLTGCILLGFVAQLKRNGENKNHKDRVTINGPSSFRAGYGSGHFSCPVPTSRMIELWAPEADCIKRNDLIRTNP